MEVYAVPAHCKTYAYLYASRRLYRYAIADNGTTSDSKQTDYINVTGSAEQDRHGEMVTGRW